MTRLLALLTLIFSLTACQADTSDMTQWLANGVIIDTRTVEEFNSGHIEGAVLVPYDVIAQRIASVVPDKSTPVLLYCRSGRRAGIAEKTLLNMGYTQVKNVGGLTDMQKFIESHQK